MMVLTPGHTFPDVTIAARVVAGSHAISSGGPAVRKARGRAQLSALAVRSACKWERCAARLTAGSHRAEPVWTELALQAQ